MINILCFWSWHLMIKVLSHIWKTSTCNFIRLELISSLGARFISCSWAFLHIFLLALNVCQGSLLTGRTENVVILHVSNIYVSTTNIVVFKYTLVSKAASFVVSYHSPCNNNIMRPQIQYISFIILSLCIAIVFILWSFIFQSRMSDLRVCYTFSYTFSCILVLPKRQVHNRKERIQF